MKSKITIGRDSTCDIRINDSYEGVSRNHAVIYFENGRIFFEDNSTNGSFINGSPLNYGRKEIRTGDTIYLGKHYCLLWSDINPHLSSCSYRETVKMNHSPSPQSHNSPIDNYRIEANEPLPIERNRNTELNKWNWGAFFFGWLWAVCNGIYWPLIVIIPYIGWVAALIINIILGVKGNEWAWNAKQWNSFDHFLSTQKKWTMAALYVFVGSIALIFLSFLIIFSLA